MNPLLFKKEPWKKISRAITASVLAAGIFCAKPARADPPAESPPPRLEQSYSVLGGARISVSPGLSFQPLSETLQYSGFSYHIGDEDFRLRLDNRQVGVIDFFQHNDYSDTSRLGDVLHFGHALLDNLGVDRPGVYHHRLGASLEGFGEGYARYRAALGDQRFTSEIGLSAYALARANAYVDLNIDYDNPTLPLRLDSSLLAGYRASMLSHTDLGMEISDTSSPIGFGVAARRFEDFSSIGSMDSGMHFNLADGFNANMRDYFWRSKLEGTSVLPYLTFTVSADGVRQYVNIGPDIRFEHLSARESSHSLSTGSDAQRSVTDSDFYRIRVVPAVSYLAAFENSGNVIPVFSFTNRDQLMARGALGMLLGPAFISASADTARDTSTEFLMPINGTITRNEARDYLVSNEMARIGFFPSFRSRMMFNRQRFITSSERLLWRSAFSYDREFSEFSGENGVIYSRGNFFLDSGLRVFGGENFGGGVYNNIGTRDFYLSTSYSSSFGGAGPWVQSAFLSVGGTIR